MSGFDFKPVSDGVDLWVKQVPNLLTQDYRDLVYDILKRLVSVTPQFSGKAVANWNVSIGSPNFDWDEDLGDDIEPTLGEAHKMGDRKWANIALRRNKPIIDSIRYRDKVFISNGVRGDAGPYSGAFDLAYLDAMQVPGKWQDRLREVNRPFESVQETMIIVGTRYLKKGLLLPKAGGFSWQQGQP